MVKIVGSHRLQIAQNGSLYGNPLSRPMSSRERPPPDVMILFNCLIIIIQSIQVSLWSAGFLSKGEALV